MVMDGGGGGGGDGAPLTTLTADALVVGGAACATGREVAPALPGTADGVDGATAEVLKAADATFSRVGW